MENKSNSVFDKKNFILIGVGTLLVIIGFLLMMGSGTTLDHFEPDIFSVRRIRVAPMVSLLGFIVMIFGILYKKKD
jgi:formate hydrogenlyase subunit 3/multisubunit Na+/H+ antiporter MnhD subunit